MKSYRVNMMQVTRNVAWRESRRQADTLGAIAAPDPPSHASQQQLKLLRGTCNTVQFEQPISDSLLHVTLFNTFCLVLKWFSWFSFSGLRYQLSAYYYLWDFWAVSTVHIVIKGSRYVSANISCWHDLDMLCLLDWREKAERIVILSGHIKWITHQSWRIS